MEKPGTGLITVSEVAYALGLKESTIRQMVWERRISYIKVGRCVRFKPETISKVIAAGEVPQRPDR
jgi:excisionase family DNA binding protein